MGSQSGTNIPVVDAYTTANYSFRRHAVDISKVDSKDDIRNTIVTAAPTRAIGSGTIVTQSGVCHYYEELVTGMTLPGRVVNARVPHQDLVQARSLNVDLAGNKTNPTVEVAMQPYTPQQFTVHCGGRVVRRSSQSGLIDRI